MSNVAENPLAPWDANIVQPWSAAEFSVQYHYNDQTYRSCYIIKVNKTKCKRHWTNTVLKENFTSNVTLRFKKLQNWFFWNISWNVHFEALKQNKNQTWEISYYYSYHCPHCGLVYPCKGDKLAQDYLQITPPAPIFVKISESINGFKLLKRQFSLL